jgi:hypothetical protein
MSLLFHKQALIHVIFPRGCFLQVDPLVTDIIGPQLDMDLRGDELQPLD